MPLRWHDANLLFIFHQSVQFVHKHRYKYAQKKALTQPRAHHLSRSLSSNAYDLSIPSFTELCPIMSRLKRLVLLISLVSLLFVSGCAYKNHIKQGDTLYAQGNYEAALTQYEAALDRRPESEEAQLRVKDAQDAFIAQLSAETYALLDEQNHPAALEAAFALEVAFGFALDLGARSSTSVLPMVTVMAFCLGMVSSPRWRGRR